MKNKKHIIIPGVLLALSAALLMLARRAEGFADWYSENIYDIAVGTIGRAAGVFPFSVSEVLLYVVTAAAAVFAVRVVLRKAGKAEAAMLLYLVCGLFFLYSANCGVNYYRTSFAESIGLEAGDYTASELERVCAVLTEELNALADDVARDENGAMVLTCDTAETARTDMMRLAEEYSPLEGYYPKPKGLIFPWILSVQKITGIYSPFTAEANYNSGMTAYNIPFTACHELSHLRGFMREEEANFIGWLACRQSEEAEFRYSGSLRGWISCMNVLYRADYEKWAALRVQLNPLVEYDLAANKAYWDKYEGKVAETAEKINDGYLKVNGQADGVKSYGRMSDLIVVWMEGK